MGIRCHYGGTIVFMRQLVHKDIADVSLLMDVDTDDQDTLLSPKR